MSERLEIATEIPNLRPAVISQKTLQFLDEYRGFRHVVRNVYAYNFETAKLRKLVAGLPAVLAHGRSELLAFAEFLEQQGS